MLLSNDLPVVLFPVETVTRELESKLIMASALASKGCCAIVGHKDSMQAIGAASTRVVWQGKSLFRAKSSDHLADQLIRKQSAIMLLHDEGGIHQVKGWQSHVLKTHRIEHLRKRSVDRVCVWGERQKDVLSSYATELEPVIAVTGTPKFDVCLPDFAWVTAAVSDELRKKYGPFVLVCTRFDAVTHSAGQGDPFRRRMNPMFWPQNLNEHGIADLWFNKWQRDVHDFADFVVLTKELATNFPQYTVVVRPHPSENIVFYQQAFAPFKNVTVTRDENVLAWIRAADLVVHSNCTTGIEAVLAGRPVLNLLPQFEERSELDVEVAREAGYVAGSIDEALQKAGNFLSGDVLISDWSPRAKAILSNLTAEAIPKVVDETMKVLDEQRITSSKAHLPRQTTLLHAWFKTSSSYESSKRGPLNAPQVEAIIDGYRRKYAGGGRIRRMTHKYVVIGPM